MTDEKITLYRPVGPEELKLIQTSGFRRFPPRLPEQPIFYPVVQKEYALEIARRWNVAASGFGYVTRFRVEATYLERHVTHEVGGRGRTEYWIPAEELELFNDNIVGRIEVIAEFMADEWGVAYDLAADQETIASIQKATLTTEKFGVVPEVALFGSEEWWAALRDGRIPKNEVRGVISRVFMTGHGDWPEFELVHEGSTTTWPRLGEQSLYLEGKEAKVEFVRQKLRGASKGQEEMEQVLRVLVKR